MAEGEDKYSSLKEAFKIYQKIANGLDDGLVQIQNERNYREFQEFIHQSIAEIEILGNKLKEIDLNGEASLFKKQQRHFHELITKLHSLKEDLVLPYMLYVIGVGNAGKSSVINSLVGFDVADIGTLPKTWKTDLFYKNTNMVNVDDLLVEIRYRDGSTQVLSEYEAKKLINQEEKKRKESEKEIRDKFRDLSKNISLIEDKEILRKELRDEYLYRSSIKEVRWALDDIKEESILNKFTLIDTPGLSQVNDSTHGEDGVRGEDIGDFYHQADGVLWVLDATAISGNTPKAALNNLEQALAKVNPENIGIKNIIAVLNFSDKIISQGGEVALDEVVDSAKRIFGNKFLEIVPYSAKQAVEAIKTNNKELLECSGYNKLCSIINKYFYSNAVDLRISSKAQGFRGEIVTYTNDYLNDYLQRLENDNEKIQVRNRKVDWDLNSLKEHLISEWSVLFAEYKKAVKDNIDKKSAQLIERPDTEHAQFMEIHIFNLDLLRNYISQYRRVSTRKISDTVEKYHKYDMENFSEYKYIKKLTDKSKYSENTLKEVSFLESINLSSADGTSLLIGSGAALLGLALLGPIGIVAGLIGFMFGKSKVDKAKEELNEKLNNLELSLSEDNAQFISALFSKGEDELKSSAKTAWARIHASTEPEYIQSLFAKLALIKNKEFHKKLFAHMLFNRN